MGAGLLWGELFNSQSYEEARKPNLSPGRGMCREKTHLRQIILSWLNLRASRASDGSMMPPRSRSTRWSVDSVCAETLQMAVRMR